MLIKIIKQQSSNFDGKCTLLSSSSSSSSTFISSK